jgi:hypothetical protein
MEQCRLAAASILMQHELTKKNKERRETDLREAIPRTMVPARRSRRQGALRKRSKTGIDKPDLVTYTDNRHPSGLQARVRIDVQVRVRPDLITYHIKSRSLEAGFVIILINTFGSAAPPQVRGDCRTLRIAADQEHRDPANLVFPQRPKPRTRGYAHSPVAFQ